MSFEAHVKFARAYDTNALIGPVVGGGEVYSARGLTFRPGRETIPLVINHNSERQVGTVHGFFVLDWVDQRWVVARATVDTPPPWLRRGTPASFCHRRLHSYEFNNWTVITDALVEEITVVGPGFAPVEPDAEVLLYEKKPTASSPAAARGASDRTPAAGEVIDGGGQTLFRPNIGRVTHVGGQPLGR